MKAVAEHVAREDHRSVTSLIEMLLDQHFKKLGLTPAVTTGPVTHEKIVPDASSPPVRLQSQVTDGGRDE